MMTENQTKLCEEQLEFTTVQHEHHWVQNEEAVPEEPQFMVDSEMDRLLVYGLSNRKVAALRSRIRAEYEPSFN